MEYIYISKENNSKHQEQFRPTSLLSVDGKIFFGVVAKRMMRFVLNNKFIDISIQRAEISGFPGRVEHASMLWDRIKAARNNKSAELHVIWLDLENAYGSVRHPLIEKAMDFFWILETLESIYTINIHIWDFLMLNIPRIGRN